MASGVRHFFSYSKIQNRFTNTYVSYFNFDKYEEDVKARRNAKTGNKVGKGTVGRPTEA